MISPNMTVGELVATIRDASFIVGILVFGWKARDIIQPLIDFFKEAKATMSRANKHMTIMERNVSLLMSNHLKHIAADLHTISGNHTYPEFVEVEAAAVEAEQDDAIRE
jgi:hypothetical protein